MVINSQNVSAITLRLCKDIQAPELEIESTRVEGQLGLSNATNTSISENFALDRTDCLNRHTKPSTSKPTNNSGFVVDTLPKSSNGFTIQRKGFSPKRLPIRLPFHKELYRKVEN